jgi:hypothetical protein
MLIDTIHGPMEDTLLEKRVDVVDNDIEHTEATEYWFEGELVHRSAHVHLKQGLSSDAQQALFG